MNNSNNKIFKKAGFWERLLAYLIDTVFIFIIIYSLRFCSINIEGILIPLIIILYNAFFLWNYGATIGKKILRLKVVNSDYQRLGVGEALFRELFKNMVSGLFNLGYLWVLIDRKKQSWHDKVVKTFVVKLGSDGNLIPIQSDEIVTGGRKVAFILLFILSFLLDFIFILFFIYSLVGSPVQIMGNAMNPNYKNGQYYMTNKMVYRKTEPKRGDVVILTFPKDSDVTYIKRIVGLPGEKIEISQGKVYINDILLNEAYLAPGTSTNIWEGGFIKEGVPVTIPADEYFVLGDNRLHSSDSRELGFISKKNIISKIWFCYYRCK